MLPGARLFAAMLLLASACAEDSSFVLRWRVGRTEADADASPLRSVRQCSDLGLGYVRVTTTRADDNREADVREFPCFPDAFADPDGSAPGPELAAGTYNVYVLGLTRRGLVRPNPAAPDDTDQILARDVARVVVNARGEGTLVDSFRLVGVDECHDGIDNDLDGAVDQSDAPCRRGLASEVLDATGAQFSFRAALLPGADDPEGKGNPRATCDDLGIATYRVILDDDPAQRRDMPCAPLVAPFSDDLEPGTHTWSVVALDAQGDPLTAPIAGEPFVVRDRQYTLVPIDVAFTLDTFLAEPAFAAPLRFALDYASTLTPERPRACEEDGSDLVIETVKLTLLADTADATMQPVTDVTVPGLMDAAFPVTASCLDLQKYASKRVTSPLPWSADGNREYYLVVEAFGADPDVACFSNAGAPARLAPGSELSLTIPRVDGACAD